MPDDQNDPRVFYAADRTVLAAERTYAAWVRTGLVSLVAGVGATVRQGGKAGGGGRCRHWQPVRTR